MLGTAIGNYTLTAKIGEGGQGTVYLAEHPVLGRRAAVKVLLPQLSTQREVIARFFNEARAAAAIRHPSIVEVFDVGYLSDASAYIVMEYLAGECLAARCRRTGRFEVGRALALVRQIAGALAAAHDAGIVHRDLKPDNVFIVSDPEVPGGERIKILDFGIAKLTGEAGERSRTQTGTVLGTPTYISPEQCRGTGQVDARADLYTLGCVLHELVCGRPPFVVDGVEGAGELIAHHLYFEPRPPRTFEPALPEAVERLILWLLRKDPSARPQTARALIDAIDGIDPGGGAGAAQRAGLAGSGRASSQAPAAHSSASLPAHSTTLSAATGMTAAELAARPRRRWLTVGVAATTIVLGGVVYFAATGSRGEPRSTQAVAAPAESAASPSSGSPSGGSPSAAKQEPPRRASVHLAIDSDPPDAAVLVDGKQIGTTPLAEDVTAGGPARVYAIHKDGYRPATATLETTRDGSRRITLERQPPEKPEKPPASLGDQGINPFDH